MRGRSGSILQPEQEAYLDGLLPPPDDLVARMDRAGREAGVPIVDREVGVLLELLVRLHRPGRVLEVGTAIGFSALHILRGLPAGGDLVSLDVDEARQALARGFLEEDGHAGRFTLVCRPALEAIPDLPGPWDMVFLDGPKEEYRACLEQLLPALPPGAMVACDNLLWDGRAAGGPVPPGAEASTRAIRTFNAWFCRHPDLLSQVLAVGDGFGLAWRR